MMMVMRFMAHISTTHAQPFKSMAARRHNNQSINGPIRICIPKFVFERPLVLYPHNVLAYTLRYTKKTFQLLICNEMKCMHPVDSDWNHHHHHHHPSQHVVGGPADKYYNEQIY